MVMLQKPSVSGDVFIREDLTRPYDSESVLVDNSAGTVPMLLNAGHPMNVAVPATVINVTAGDVTSAVLNTTVVPVGELVNVAVLARGVGVVINESAMPITAIDEGTGGDFIAGQLKTAYEALNFVVRLEPATVEVQTD